MTSLLVYTDGEVLGDGIVRVPFIAALKHAMRQLRLIWVCGSASVYTDSLHDLVRPYIDECIMLPPGPMPMREYLAGPRIFAGRTFDIVLDTQRNFKRALWLSRIPHGVFISAAGKYLLSSRKPARAGAKRMIDHVFNLGELALGVRLTPQPVILPDPKWAAAARAYLPEQDTSVGLVVGAGHPNKCWKLEYFLQLAQELAADGIVIVFLLGPREAELAATIRAALPTARIPLLDAPRLAAECGIDAASPYFTIALGSLLSACIANDSGGGHLVAAGGAPMVSLFRSHSVREKFLPAAPRVIGLAPEDFGMGAMRDIPLDAVRAALRKILQPSALFGG